MKNQQLSHTKSTAELEARISALESALLEKDAVISGQKVSISEKESVISKKDTVIKKLTGDVEYLSFQNDQLRRLIFGSKRERFIPQSHPGQLTIDFEPQAAEIEASVKAEQEKIRVEYERKKAKKEHPGRMQLPAHLPVNEIILEPAEDTTDMVCIGQEVTEELDYTPAKLHINRYIRNKYITKEDEKASHTPIVCIQGDLSNDR